MRCSVQTDAMVAAGPGFNFLAAIIFASLLSLRRRRDNLGYFLWLCAGFNLLVACGYMIVGAAGFGDWFVLITDLAPLLSWPWRILLGGLGLAGYIAGMSGLARLYHALAGTAGFAQGILLRRTLLPASAAAVVACAAEIIGGRPGFGPIALALGTTLFVGWTLSRLEPPRRTPSDEPAVSLTLRFSPVWAAAAILAATLFVFEVGPVTGPGA
jgi:hypothetical protein